MTPLSLIAVYCVCIIASSLLGGLLPSLLRLTHMRLQLMMSGVGGLMLGIGLFHLLPHAVGGAVTLDRAIWWLMMGLLTTFFLIRVFHGHSHATVELDRSPATTPVGADVSGSLPAHHHADHDHLQAGCDHSETLVKTGKIGWVGIALGLSLHTALDGVALAASVLHDQQESPTSMFWGFAVFLGILLHKPLDSLSITSLMSAGGWSNRMQQFVNFGYSLMCPVGAAVFFLGVARSPDQTVLVGCAWRLPRAYFSVFR